MKLLLRFGARALGEVVSLSALFLLGEAYRQTDEMNREGDDPRDGTLADHHERGAFCAEFVFHRRDRRNAGGVERGEGQERESGQGREKRRDRRGVAEEDGERGNDALFRDEAGDERRRGAPVPESEGVEQRRDEASQAR